MSDGPHPLDPLRELVAGAEPGRWWFRIERWSGDVWDRLCPAMHDVASYALRLAEPRHLRFYDKG